MPVSDYWNTDDALYDLSFAPPEGTSIQPALSTFLAVPFGVAFNAFEHTTLDRHSAAALADLKEVLGPLVERAVAQAARQFATLVPERQSGAEAVAEVLTNILFFLGLAAMREFSRQFGWIPSQFRVPREVVDASVDPLYVDAIQRNVMSTSFVTIAEQSPAFSAVRDGEKKLE
jgi:hypothetical protein